MRVGTHIADFAKLDRKQREARLRDEAEKWLRRLGYSVERRSPAQWTITEQLTHGDTVEYDTYVRTVPSQPRAHDGSDFILTGFKRRQLHPNHRWVVAWYKQDPSGSAASIELTFGDRGKLEWPPPGSDVEGPYRTVVDGRELDQMKKGDYIKRDAYRIDASGAS